MAIDYPLLPVGPLPHRAMDYARLRAEGLRLLGQLAGERWSDFNVHDPGITILEQLCYAITDLAYRCNHPIPDLLAGHPEARLPGPAEILPCDPVTDDDLRRLALALGAGASAWVGEPPDPGPRLYVRPGGELVPRPPPDEPAAEPLVPRGLVHVAIQRPDTGAGDPTADLERISRRLHAARPLGCDLAVAWLKPNPVEIRADIEVEAVGDPTGLLADIVERIEDCLCPPTDFVPLAQALAEGRPLERLFEGPAPERGAIDALPRQRRAVFASALIRALTDLPAVRTVRSLQPERIAILPGTAATLDQRSRLTLWRGDVELAAHRERALDLVRERRRARRVRTEDLDALAPPPGRDRALGRHRSLRRQLPACYGVGPLGIQDSATPERRAQVRQLEVYLTIFDQLLANQLAQLANVWDLLSPAGSGSRSYFAAPAEDPPLDLYGLLAGGASPDAAADYGHWLQQQVEPEGAGVGRRRRLLAHLLARYAEELIDSPPFAKVPVADDPLARRREFLRDYPRLGRARGTGCDLREVPADPGGDPLPARGASALHDRLRLKLGVPGLRFELVEHILLRPLPEDRNQVAPDEADAVPFLTGLAVPDPWSLRLSCVCRQPGPEVCAPERLAALREHVAETLLAEVPAHLAVHLHWLDEEGEETWSAFERAWLAFRRRLRDHRWPARTAGVPAPDPRLAQLRLRDARDRLIELLGLGLAYPLRDLPLDPRLGVPAGTGARILLGFSQRGVIYRLTDVHGRTLPSEDAPIEAEGTDGELLLIGPPIEPKNEVVYRIRATPRGPRGRERAVWLLDEVRAVEGIDRRLTAEILDLPLLERSIDYRRPGDARIADDGAPVRVAVHRSQIGVRYDLRDAANLAAALSEPVAGTAETIELTLAHASADMDLRIRGRKLTEDPDACPSEEGLLEAVLPLRVRADPAVPILIDPPIADYGAAPTLRLPAPQPQVAYRVWARALDDADYLDLDPREPAALEVEIDGGRCLRVARPTLHSPWRDPPGFAPLDLPARATDAGEPIEIPLSPAERDLLLIVEAVRTHAIAPASRADGRTVRSSVALAQALLLPVRPDPRRPVIIETRIDAGQAVGPWSIRDGEPGCFYELLLDGQPIGPPAWFHRRGAQDPRQNRGIGALRIGHDLVVARDLPAMRERAGTPPAWPLVDSAPLPLGVELRVRARRAATGLACLLEGVAVVDPIPPLRLEPCPDGTVRVVVEESVPGERYRLVWTGAHRSAWSGAWGGATEEGTGADLAVAGVPVYERSVPALVVERSVPGRLRLLRRLELDAALFAGTFAGAGEP